MEDYPDPKYAPRVAYLLGQFAQELGQWDEAVASYTRTDDFVDARTGRPMHVAVRLTKTLKRQDGAWKLAASK